MKKIKKIASLLLALVMAVAMSVTAFASGTDGTSNTSTLTIKATAGHTYSIYQLLTGDVSSLNNGSGTLSNVKAGANLKAGTSVDGFVADINGKTNGELGDTAYGYVTGEPAYTTGKVGTSGDTEVTVVNGYYLVMDSYTGDSVTDGSDTISRYMVAVVGDTTMEPKVSTPEIDKKIIDTDANAAIDGDIQKTDTAAIGDVIEYEVTGQVPNTEGYKYYYYVLKDTLSKGLTLDQNSFEVTIGNQVLTKDTDYYVYFDEANNSFVLALEDLKALVNAEDNDIAVGSTISVKYSATVNDNAAIGLDPNTNTVKLQYSNNPNSSERKDVTGKPGTPEPGTATGEGPEKTTKTYVTELSILKVDQNGQKLEGAEFTLTGKNLNKVIIETSTTFEKAADGTNGEYYKLKNGTYTKTAPSDAKEGEEGYNQDQYDSLTPEYVRVTTVTASTEAGEDKKIVGKVNEEGYVIFTGLNAGEYTLTETKTPEGYNTIAPIEFTISADQSGATAIEGGNIIWSSNNAGIVLDKTNGVFDATIVNNSGTELPSTGGIGTTIFYVVGSILVLAAAVLLVTRRRMNTASK